MIVVTLQIPSTDPAKPPVTRKLTISNVTNLASLNDYVVTDEKGRTAVIYGHPTRAVGPWALVDKAIRALKLDLQGR